MGKCEICQCPNRHWLKTSEVAESLGCTARTIRNRIADGSLDAGRVGGLWRVEHDSLHRYLRGAVQTTNPVEPAEPAWG